jgi:hypothetical protein
MPQRQRFLRLHNLTVHNECCCNRLSRSAGCASGPAAPDCVIWCWGSAALDKPAAPGRILTHAAATHVYNLLLCPAGCASGRAAVVSAVWCLGSALHDGSRKRQCFVLLHNLTTCNARCCNSMSRLAGCASGPAAPVGAVWCWGWAGLDKIAAAAVPCRVCK